MAPESRAAAKYVPVDCTKNYNFNLPQKRGREPHKAWRKSKFSKTTSWKNKIIKFSIVNPLVRRLNLCRCNKSCSQHPKHMACSEYWSTPLKRVWNSNPTIKPISHNVPWKWREQFFNRNTWLCKASRESLSRHHIPRSRWHEIRTIYAATHFSLLSNIVVSTSCSEDSSKSPYKTNAEKQSKPFAYAMGDRVYTLQILHKRIYNSGYSWQTSV